MKRVLSGISLFLAGLFLTVNITRESVQAQTNILNPNIAATISLAQSHLPQAEAVNNSSKITVAQNKSSEVVTHMEDTWEKQYEEYFRVNFSDQEITVQYETDTLAKIALKTGKKSALLYVIPRPQHLDLVLVPAGGKAVYKKVSEVNEKVLLQQAQEFTKSIITPVNINTDKYLPVAKQLYQWIIAPIAADLKSNNIDTLIFCTGIGLRTAPLAALHDGQQFLIEKYSIGRIPAFKFTDTTYADLRNAQVLAMGASEFKEQNSLPAVPVELSAITKNLWQGKTFLNQEFTLTNLQSQRQKQPYQIIHLATHANFQTGSPRDSYIQFWDTKLTLDKMRELNWNNPSVNLLVLSACKTAIGDKNAELGFAGLAVQAKVKSVMASLWNVSDEGTLGLMTQMYQNLKTTSTKAEALRLAQIAMLKGQVRIEEGQLQTTRETISLPPGLSETQNKNFSHPYYWAAFTIFGSPW
jgi:CHAT domain-containing protein